MGTKFYPLRDQPTKLVTTGDNGVPLVLTLDPEVPYETSDPAMIQMIREYFVGSSFVEGAGIFSQMAVVAAQVSVGTTAQLIGTNSATSDSEGDYRNRTLLVKNITGGTVFLGGDNTVTTANGFQWVAATDGILSIDLEPGESLYGIVATGSLTLHTLRSGR